MTKRHTTNLKRAQKLFREWCAYHGATVEVAAAVDLVERIAREIAHTQVTTTAEVLNGEI